MNDSVINNTAQDIKIYVESQIVFDILTDNESGIFFVNLTTPNCGNVSFTTPATGYNTSTVNWACTIEHGGGAGGAKESFEKEVDIGALYQKYNMLALYLLIALVGFIVIWHRYKMEIKKLLKEFS